MTEDLNRSLHKRLYKAASVLLPMPLMLVMITGLVSSTPASPLYTPAPGTSERKAILDVERKYVEDAVAVKSVVFHDVSLSVKNGWAYVVSHPRDAAGRELWVFAQFKNKNYDPSAQALMHKESTGWKLVEFSFGQNATTEFRRKNPTAPSAIFSIGATVRRQPLASDGWTLVRQFQGNTDNLQTKTETFKVGSQWRIDWMTEEGDAGAKGSMTVFVSVAPNTPNTEATGLAISHYGGGSGKTMEYGAGEYYLQIISNQSYILRVFSRH